MTELTLISGDEARELNSEDLFLRLGSTPKGLSNAEAGQRLEVYGPNSLQEKREKPLLKFLSYFWGPIPWMIEVAAVLSAIVRHWEDFDIIVILLFFNALVGFWQERKAANALDALKTMTEPGAMQELPYRWKKPDPE